MSQNILRSDISFWSKKFSWISKCWKGHDGVEEILWKHILLKEKKFKWLERNKTKNWTLAILKHWISKAMRLVQSIWLLILFNAIGRKGNRYEWIELLLPDTVKEISYQ